jgi:DnaJ-class molecular chaperone
MVCSACNGKGYVIDRQREAICRECQGRGEFSFGDREKSRSEESRRVDAKR